MSPLFHYKYSTLGFVDLAAGGSGLTLLLIFLFLFYFFLSFKKKPGFSTNKAFGIIIVRFSFINVNRLLLSFSFTVIGSLCLCLVASLSLFC